MSFYRIGDCGLHVDHRGASLVLGFYSRWSDRGSFLLEVTKEMGYKPRPSRAALVQLFS